MCISVIIILYEWCYAVYIIVNSVRKVWVPRICYCRQLWWARTTSPVRWLLLVDSTRESEGGESDWPADWSSVRAGGRRGKVRQWKWNLPSCPAQLTQLGLVEPIIVGSNDRISWREIILNRAIRTALWSNICQHETLLTINDWDKVEMIYSVLCGILVMILTMAYLKSFTDAWIYK